MIQIDDKSSDVLIITSTIAWLLILIFCWIGNDIFSIAAFLLSFIIIAAYYWLSFSGNHYTKFKIPFLYPILVTLFFWFLAISIAYMTRGKTDYFILGLHPGVFWVIIFQWLSSFITLMLSYSIFFDKYFFSEIEWYNFIAELDQLKYKNTHRDLDAAKN